MRNPKFLRDLFNIPQPKERDVRPRYPDCDPAQTDLFSLRDFSNKEVSEEDEQVEENALSHPA
jgi:hypothetical protein